MSKFLCLCGHVTVSAIAEFVLVREQGKIEEVYGRRFVEVYSKDSGLKDFLHDILAAGYVGSGRGLYECEQCGRIWIQSRDKDEKFFPYLPEKDERGMLRSIRKEAENNG